MRSLGIIAFIGLTTLFISGSQEDNQLWLSLTAKQAGPAQFVTRLATPTGQVYVTKKPVANALASRSLSLVGAEKLLLIEAHPDADVPESRGQIGGIDIVKVAMWGAIGHMHWGDPRHQVTVVDPSQEFLATTRKEKAKLPRASRLAEFPEIDADELETWLSEFSGAVPTMVDGEEVTIENRGSSTGRRLARGWLKERYEELGYEVSEHDFANGSNFIAERAGANADQYVVISAHLDSVYNAGADDDGAGTISALAIAKGLAEMDLAYTVKVLGFDKEEAGLIGSNRYTRMINTDTGFEGLLGVFNIEMTGYDEDSDGGFHVIDCDENTSAELSQRMEDYIETYEMDLVKVNACTNASDHASYWRYDQPAVVISQNFFGGDSNPCYHRSCDQVDMINFAYMAKLTRALGGAVASIVAQ